MYPLYFYLCLIFSTGILLGLILLAIFPLHLPISTKPSRHFHQPVHRQKARSPTRHMRSTNYWEPPWEDDDEDL